jgi:hypothetical protein
LRADLIGLLARIGNDFVTLTHGIGAHFRATARAILN